MIMSMNVLILTGLLMPMLPLLTITMMEAILAMMPKKKI